MIARARRAFPGMVVSMLLAAPAMAAPSGHHAGPAHAPRIAHPVSDHRKTAHRGPRLANKGPAGKATRIVRAMHFYAPHRTAMAAVVPAMAYTGPSFNGTDTGWQQTGMASWYGGRRWSGHATSSGAAYDEAELTAAHATLPLGTRVRVTLAGSGRSVIVTINDRPGTRRRIIDLSRGAAQELGILNSGIAMVTLTVL